MTLNQFASLQAARREAMGDLREMVARQLLGDTPMQGDTGQNSRTSTPRGKAQRATLASTMAVSDGRVENLSVSNSRRPDPS